MAVVTPHFEQRAFGPSDSLAIQEYLYNQPSFWEEHIKWIILGCVIFVIAIGLVILRAQADKKAKPTRSSKILEDQEWL